MLGKMGRGKLTVEDSRGTVTVVIHRWVERRGGVCRMKSVSAAGLKVPANRHRYSALAQRTVNLIR